jgi:hypothetical protein
MTWDSVLGEYLMRIGQPGSAGSSRETIAEHLRRIRKSYNTLCKDTGATWVEPTLVELAAVTLTTNEHNLRTLLDLADADGIYSLDKVFWVSRVSPRLPEWNKQVIEEQNQMNRSSVVTYPSAYAFWTERDNSDPTDPSDLFKISYYPFIRSADTTNCYISYFRKPAAPTENNLLGVGDAASPQFNDDYHEAIAERAALLYLRDRGDLRYTQSRWISVNDEIQDMKNLYTPMITKGESIGAFLQTDGRYTLRHGERVID